MITDHLQYKYKRLRFANDCEKLKLFTEIQNWMMMISYEYGNVGLSVASRKVKCKFRP